MLESQINIEIISAYYGANTISAVDVTASVRNNPQRFASGIFISYETFGISDPAEGKRKSLVVTYKYSNNILVKSGVDGETLKLDHTWNQITINKASYSSLNMFVDITARFQDFVDFDTDNQNFTIGNQQFWNWFTNGSDPDPGQPKSLLLEFVRSGITHTVCANDGENVSLYWSF